MRLLVLGSPDSIWTREFIEFVLKRPDRKICVLYDAQTKGEFAEFYESLGVEVIRTPSVSSIVMKIPKLRSIFMLKEYTNAARSSLPYDAVINMFVTPSALSCAIAQKRYGAIVVAYFCGSDIVRADGFTRILLKKYLSKTNYAVMASANVQRAFIAKIGHLNGCKQETIRLGISVFSNIDWEITHSSIEKCKINLGISSEKITICIGYNGSKNQNHLRVLEQIKMMPPDIKKKIIVLLPMTYASTEKYITEVEVVAKETGVKFIVFKEYMQHEIIAQFRLATDIFINAQTSDGLSGSVLETLYAGALLLNASWLHYIEYDIWGLKYSTFSRFEDLPGLLADVIHVPFVRHQENREILAGTMSWEQCKNAWDTLLRSGNP